MRPIVIAGGTVLTPEGTVETSIRVEDGIIRDLDAGPADSGALTFDARGLLVAPALVDIHGDAFERQVMPRPNVFFPIDTALLDTDRQLAANGIATAYHALTLSWEPGLRSLDRGETFIEAIEQAGPRVSVDHRVQLRWEIFAFEATDLIERHLAADKKPSVAFNDHTSMMMRAFDLSVIDRPAELFDDTGYAALDDPRFPNRIRRESHRAGLSEAEYMDLLERIWGRRGEVGDVVGRLADAARAVQAPMLSHDDNRIELRRRYRDVGASIAEFPMTLEVARDACDAGEWVVLGAPNVVRGGSHIGSLDAAEMIEAGQCHILASDYFYPSMLAAVARLVKDKRTKLEGAWQTVSANPARASGLDDRGEIRVGARGDVVVVEMHDEAAPTTLATLSAGTIASLSDGRRLS